MLGAILRAFGRPHPITKAVLASLKNEPDAWSADHFSLRHPDGTEIWIANKAYGLDLTLRGRGKVFSAFDNRPAQRAFLWAGAQAWLLRPHLVGAVRSVGGR